MSARSKQPTYRVVYSWPNPINPQEPLTESHFSAEVAARLTSLCAFECPICLEDHVPNPSIAIPCGHTFCHDCVREVLARGGGRPKCPTCAEEMVKMTDFECFAYVWYPERLEIEVLKRVFRRLDEGRGVRVVGWVETKEAAEESGEEEESGSDEERESESSSNSDEESDPDPDLDSESDSDSEDESESESGSESGIDSDEEHRDGVQDEPGAHQDRWLTKMLRNWSSTGRWRSGSAPAR